MLSWYLARGAGLAAFLALSVATGAGASTSRRTADAATRVVRQYVHRAAALCGVVLLVLHVVTLLLDSYADVGLTGLLPFGSGYRPVAVTFGTLALYCLAAVATTGVLRSRMTRSSETTRVWRGIHLLSYAAWLLCAVHFLLVGTDITQWWALALLGVGVAVVAGGVVARVTGRDLPAAPVATAAPVRTAGPARVDAGR